MHSRVIRVNGNVPETSKLLRDSILMVSTKKKMSENYVTRQSYGDNATVVIIWQYTNISNHTVFILNLYNLLCQPYVY